MTESPAPTAEDGRHAPAREAAPLLALFAAEFISPTAARVHVLTAAAILTTGRRTVAGVLRTLRHLAPGHVTAYRRVLSRAEWSGLVLGCAPARRHRGRLTLVSKLHPEANLFDLPGAYRGVGRPPAKGARRAKPSQASGPDARRDELTADWYGGGTRRVGVVGEAAHWFKSGRGLVELRWVSVRDRTGTHRDEYLYATDPSLTPAEIVGYYCGRWSIEKDQADCTSKWRWVGTGRIGYHRRDGAARAPARAARYTPTGPAAGCPAPAARHRL